MLLRAPQCLVMCLLLAAATACRELPQRTPIAEGAVEMEVLPTTNAVPSEWGTLTSVTAAPYNNAAASLLWFQDDSGTVRVVGFDHGRLKLWPNVRVIRRQWGVGHEQGSQTGEPCSVRA